MGALDGITVIELAGLGPAPFCGMMLADHGARVIRVDRPGAADPSGNVLCRNRESIVVNLQQPAGCDVLLELIESADALIEGFRPGVMERLGLSPETCLARNPALVFGRMTGWGQDGPLANTAGHDINYISLAGVTDAIGESGRGPVPPLNLVGDYGGGGMFLAFGVLAAIISARKTGQGQVIDCAMIDGATALMAEYYGFLGAGEFSGPRASHLLDGGAPFYSVYETSDGKHISIGPLEPKFYRLLLDALGLEGDLWTDQMDKARWPEMKRELRSTFLTRTRADWIERLEGSDVCFAPVLSIKEASQHRHHLARGTIIDVDGVLQGSPAPRFAGTPSGKPRPARRPGTDTRATLLELGLEKDRVANLLAAGVIEQADPA